MRRLQNLNKKNVRKRNESKNDYIKRKSSYRCVYCHKTFNKKHLIVSLEPFHIVKPKERISDILKYYRINKGTLLKLNTDFNFRKYQTGSLLRVPPFYKIFPSTHSVCFCEKCGENRRDLALDHVSFIRYLLKKRKNTREKVTTALRRKVYKRDHYKCVYCEIEYGKSRPNTFITIDHKNPVVGGGTSGEANLCTSCDYHNQDKGRSDYEEYLKKIKKRKYLRENCGIDLDKRFSSSSSVRRKIGSQI
jgi:5-methylcytosine-specific restriction endonuclease McrA